MKIAITVQGETLEDMLDPRFGRAQYFMIYDTDSNNVEEVIDNNANTNASGGAGSSSAQLIANKGATAVISGNFGPNASMGLKGFDIKMYTSPVDSAKNIIENFKNNKLTEVADATVAGKH